MDRNRLELLRKNNCQGVAQAVEWLRQNAGRFNRTIYEPLILSVCSVSISFHLLMVLLGFIGFYWVSSQSYLTDDVTCDFYKNLFFFFVKPGRNPVKPKITAENTGKPSKKNDGLLKLKATRLRRKVKLKKELGKTRYEPVKLGKTR